MEQLIIEATVVPLTAEQIPNHLRWKRKWVFTVVNRGPVWYNSLTDIQKEELQTWYGQWLDAPETSIEPVQPTWLK